jgi:RNA polymerase sigma-70 factor (ECF subfamily)
MTDEEAMRALTSGDLDKAAVLYERYKRPVMGFFYRNSGVQAHAEDLMQQVFYRMIHYRNSFGETYAFKPWIYRIANNVLQDFVKKISDNERGLPPGFDLAEELDATEEQSAQLEKALQKLPAEYREVIFLSRFEELKYHEIAEIVGISVALVKVRVHRGLKILREIYIQEE